MKCKTARFVTPGSTWPGLSGERRSRACQIIRVHHSERTSFKRARLKSADAMLGIGYAISPNAKISLNYRVDVYFDALRVIDITNNAVNVTRLYHGPSLRLTVQY